MDFNQQCDASQKSVRRNITVASFFGRWGFCGDVSTPRRNMSLGLSYQTLEPRQVLTSPLPSFPVDSGVLYQVHGVRDAQGQLSEIDVINQSFVDIGQRAGFKINGTGFRVADGYIYGVKMSTDELMRIGANGENEVLGAVDGLPNGSFFTGDFGVDGLLYLRHGNQYFGVDVDGLKVERVVTADSDVRRTYDIAFNPKTDLHYSVRKNGTRAEFISIDLSGGNDTAEVVVINDNLKPVGTFGAMFSDASGRVFAANNAGGLYEIDSVTGVATFAGHSPKASSNDGAFSAAATLDLPPVAFDAWVTLAPTESATPLPVTAPYDLDGQEVTVTVTALPTVGSVTDSVGNNLEVGQVISIETLTSLLYDAPENSEERVGAVLLNYQVSDGQQQVEAKVEISFAGLSRIEGNVFVLDDTEESSYEGYACQNEIRLIGVDLLGEAVERTVNTDVEGRYRFEDVLPGVYRIEQSQPEVVYSAYVERNELEGDVETNKVVGFSVGNEPRQIQGADFYEFAPSLLSGFVYVDANNNGLVDVVEDGVGNVTIELTGTDFYGDAVFSSVVTDSFGFYDFTGLAPGDYQLREIQPEGYHDANVSFGSVGGVVVENRVEDVVLWAGEQGNGYHFGEHLSSSLSGSVFLDNDIDRVFDQGDTPLFDVKIVLTGIDVFGSYVQLEAATDIDGGYRFDNLVAGTYALTEQQPDDVANGYSHVGVFNNDKTKLPGNGVAGTNQIQNIEVGFGRHGRSFDFSESIDYRFTNQFDQTVSYEGTAGDDLIEFTPGSEYHTLNINGIDFQVDASLRSNIEVRGGSGADRFVINGSEQVEQVITTTGRVLMRSEMWRFEATEGESFFVDSGGGYDRAFMYDSGLDDRVKMTQDYSRLWSDQGLAETRGYHRTYAFAVNGGEDRAYLYDSKYDDTVKMTDRNARMISRKFYAYAGTFERVYAYSLNGGSDRAQFWDSVNDVDIMQATPDYARMYNEGLFYNQAARFGQVDAFAYSGGSNDRAYLVGSEGDDQLIASPAKSGMAGEGFKFDMHGFERSYAFANGGNDRALLFDSKLDDRFVARPDAARMYNDQYFLNAKGYARVDGFSSSGGNDRAYFYDSDGDDVLVAHETKMRLFGAGFDNNSHGFKRAYAHAIGGGNDQGLLYDTDQADTVKLDQEIAKMYGEGYYNWLHGFDQVDARFASSNRHDRALVFGAINQDQLSVSGDQAKLIYDHASEFIYDIDAHSGDDGDDSDLSSIYEDLLSILGDV